MVEIGDNCGLESILKSKLLYDARDMSLDCPLCDTELSSESAVGCTAPEEHQYLPLAVC
jgi:hypothetical protein